MAKDINYPHAFVSNDVDNPTIAYTDNVKDTPFGMMQRALNNLLSKYFNFKADGNPQDYSLNGRILSEKSVGIDRLTEDLQSLINAGGNNTALTQLQQEVANLKSVVQNMQSDVTYLMVRKEYEDYIGPCEEDGLFIIDANGFVGACITPDYAGGWDGTDYDGEGTASHTSKETGGTYIRTYGVDFSSLHWGTIGQGESNPDYFSIDTISITVNEAVNNMVTGTSFTVTATPDSNHQNYNGGYRWFLASDGSDSYISFANPGSTAATVRLNITPGTNTPVTIGCEAVKNSHARASKLIMVKYDNSGTEAVALERITGIEIYDDNGNLLDPSQYDSENPAETAYVIIRALYTPSTATIVSGNVNIFKNTSDHQGYSIGSSSILITENGIVKFLDTSGSEKHFLIPTTYSQYGYSFWVNSTDDFGNTKTKSTSISEAFYLSNSSEKAPTRSVENVYIDCPSEITEVNTQLYVKNAIDDEIIDPAYLHWTVESGNASIDYGGMLTVVNAEVGDSIDISVVVDNPDYPDDSDVATFESYKSITNKCVLTQGKFKIAPENGDYELRQLQFTAVSSSGDPVDATWTIVNSGKASLGGVSVTRNGLLTVNSDASSWVYVKVRAITTAGAIVEGQYRFKYRQLGGEDISYIRLMWNEGGEYVDFYTYGTNEGLAGDGGLNHPYDVYTTESNVTWDTPETYTSDQANTAAASSTSPAPAMAAVRTIPSIAGTEDATIMASDYDTSIAENVAIANTYLYLQSDVTAVIDPSSSLVIPTKAKKRGAGYPKFGDGTTEHKNRLYLDPNKTGKQGVVVSCVLYDENNSNVIIAKCNRYFEFEYKANIYPVTGIRLKNIPQSSGSVVHTNQAHTDIWFDAPDRTLYSCRDWFEPIPAAGLTVDNYNFDPERVHLTHLDGYPNTSLCGLYYWNQASAARAMYNANGDETWVATYNIGGEAGMWAHQYLDVVSKDGAPSYTMPVPRIMSNVYAHITGPGVPEQNITSVTLVKEDVYEAFFEYPDPESVDYDPEAKYWVIAEGRLYLKDQNGVAVPSSRVSFSVVEGQEYCIVNRAGDMIAVCDPDRCGDAHSVVIKYTCDTGTTTLTNVVIDSRGRVTKAGDAIAVKVTPINTND